MLKIAPSILAADFCRLDRELERVPNADWLHVDVMDGCFVQNISVGLPVVESLRAHTDLFLDVHLMIAQPERWVERFARAGADQVCIHMEAAQPPALRQALAEMERCGVKKAVALRPTSAAESVRPYLEQLDMVLVMTVEPGFGGQSFLEGQLETIRRVRAMIDRVNPRCELEIDGGVSAKTIRPAAEAGASVMVAGSAVFGAPDPARAIEELRGRRSSGYERPAVPFRISWADDIRPYISTWRYRPMEYFPPALEKLVEQFAKLPGVGRKSAQRLAFYVLSLPKEEAEEFAGAITAAQKAISCCPVCQNLTEGDGPCPICRSAKRDQSVICVVADPKDVIAMERSREYSGSYHVLHGVISPMNHVGPDDLRVKELVSRVAAGGVEEVIMATNPDTEGEATAMYLSRLLKPFAVKTTRLAYGIPVGSHLEFADDATLMRALEGRREI